MIPPEVQAVLNDVPEDVEHLCFRFGEGATPETLRTAAGMLREVAETIESAANLWEQDDDN